MKELFKKIITAEINIGEWYQYWEGQVYISFSGGKDSLVLLDIARKLYPDIPAVFCDTGLEYPSVRISALEHDNTIKLRPALSFASVIKKYGYPIISKDVSQKIENVRNSTNYMRNLCLTQSINGASLPIIYHYLIEAPFLISNKCCTIMKKRPFHAYEKKTNRKPIVGVMAGDSMIRKLSWNQYGCNAFKMKNPQSRPIMTWNTHDIWEYINMEKIKYPDIYNMGIAHTGCMFCGFGIYYDNSPNRYEILKKLYPKIHTHIIKKMGFGNVLDFIGVNY